MNKVKILVLVCYLVLATTHLSFAQLFLEQGKVKATITPGESIAQKINVNNQSGKPMKVRAYWEGFQYQAPFDGAKKFLPRDDNQQSPGSWVTFSPHEFDLPAFGKQEISYVVSPPKDLEEGGYYGVIFFEKTQEGTLQSEKGLSIVTRVGTLFFLETKNKNKTAKIDDVTLNDGEVVSLFKNTGNVVLIPDGVYYIMDRESLVVDRGSVNKVYLPPGGETEYKFDFSNELPDGEYTLVLTVDLEDGEVVVKEVDFEKQGASYEIKEVRD